MKDIVYPTLLPGNCAGQSPAASNPAPVPESGIYEAVRAFVLTYALPALQPQNVFQGWQNRSSLPAGSEDYAVIGILSAVQHGTTVETFSAPDPDRSVPGILKIEGLMKVAARIDFCGGNDPARVRAQRCAVVARSSIGVSFFNKRGLSALYADDVRDLSFVGDAKQFVRRYSTTLHLSCWSGDSVELPYFNTVKVARLENVDVHHPVKGA